MAKKATPRFLTLVLGALAVAGAYSIGNPKPLGSLVLRLAEMGANGGNFRFPFGTKTETGVPSLLPPEADGPAIAPRPDAALYETWKGKPVPRILVALASPATAPGATAGAGAVPSTTGGNDDSAQPTPATANDKPVVPLTLAEITDPDPYLPGFVTDSDAPAELPPADDAIMLDGDLIVSANGRPLSLPAPEKADAAAVFRTLGGRRLAPADFDGDGDVDVFIGRGAGLPSSLLRRAADGSFEDITTAAGLLDFLDLIDAAWVDFDRDGRLDLFTLSAPAKSAEGGSPLRLYRNLDGKTFAEISQEIRLSAPGKAEVRAFLWRDIDGDAFPDLLLSLAGDPGSLRLLEAIPARRAGDWRFADATDAFGLKDAPGGGPLAAGDFDRDGRDDLVIATDATLSLFLGGREDPRFAPFSDLTDTLKLGGVPRPADLVFEDLDRDGFLDLVVTGGDIKAPATRAWWNVGGLRFREIPGAGGLRATVPLRRIIPIDAGGDGVIGMLLAAGPDHGGALLNPAPETGADNHRVVIQLSSGAKLAANPEARGARLTLVVRDENWTLSTIERAVDSRAEIVGLGAAAAIESLTVHWPDREKTVTRFEKPLPIDHLIEISPDPKTLKITPLPGDTPPEDHGS